MYKFARTGLILLSIFAHHWDQVSAQGKRGLAYNDASLANLFEGYSQVTWGYNWGYPASGLSSSLEFVPMLWGLPSGSDPDWTAAVETPGTTHILGFNEPDLGWEANISSSDAATGYMTYMQPFAGLVSIGMPGISNGPPPSEGVGWDEAFMRYCNLCDMDFAPIHWYGTANTSAFTSYVEDAYVSLNRPIWVTEFEASGTDAEEIAFLQDVLPWLDEQTWVQRYAYFGVFEGYLVNADGTGLSDIGQTYATYTA